MPNDTSSILGIEIGSENTRAVMFDVVEGTYQFLASGVAPSTQKEPFFDIGEGILAAISQLQTVIGRTLVDHEGNLIIPAQTNGEGVDRLFITVSGGPEVRIATFGLLNEVSLESANRLATTSYGVVMDSFGINDRRSIQVQMENLLAVRPEIILFGGGTNRGASRSVVRVAQMMALILSQVPADRRPEILFCGNRTVAKTIQEILEKYVRVTISANIRPTLEVEELQKSSEDLALMVLRVWMKRMSGLNRIAPLCSEAPSISSLNYQRMVRFLGKLYDPTKAVLGIDLGSQHTTISSANATNCGLNIFSLGTGAGFEEVLAKIKVDDIANWLTENVSADELKEILWQKTLYPGSIPMDEKGLGIELAATRAIIAYCLRELKRQTLLIAPTFEPIFVSGSTITHTPTSQQILLTLLDGIQPTGITPLIIDKHGLLPILGAISKVNSLLPVQVMESTAFINLATVITPECHASEGTTILKARLTYHSGNYMDLEVKQGSLATLPLASGETGLLSLDLLHRTFVDGLVDPETPIKIHGGICGIVFDARGRPAQLPKDENAKRDRYKRWMFMLGA